MYSREQINELKSKINYHEFYSRYIEDVPNNKNKVFVCCPFHREVKPSFQIDLEYGLWHCWGACNTGGDVFSFYQKYFSVSFNEAVEQIAELYNYELVVSEEEKQLRENRKKLYSINSLMCEKYQLSLKRNNDAYNYLYEIRGFSPKIIESFKLGCGIDKLPDKESLKKLGLLRTNSEGRNYAHLGSDRIIIPRFDEYGHIIGFTGRLYVDKDKAKYSHTPETEINKKSEHVFGLYQAKKYIKHLNSVILVEGNLDVIKCHQKSISNTVGLDGLNISETQVNLLKKYTNTFYICVEDGAILKTNEQRMSSLDKIYNTIKEHIPYSKIYIVDLRGKNGEKCDPDMFLNEHTREEFMDKIKHAKIYNEFIINSKLVNVNPKNIEEKNACLSMLIPNLAKISNFLDRKQYIELVANKLLISENDIYRKLKYFNEKQNKISSENIVWDSKPIYAQKILLSCCFCKKFDTNKVLLKIMTTAITYMKDYFKSIFKDYILTYANDKRWANGVDYKEFFDNITSNNDIEDEIKNTIMDCYLKSDELDDLEPNDYIELIDEQIETLKEYVYTETKVEDELLSLDI